MPSVIRKLTENMPEACQYFPDLRYMYYKKLDRMPKASMILCQQLGAARPGRPAPLWRVVRADLAGECSSQGGARE